MSFDPFAFVPLFGPRRFLPRWETWQLWWLPVLVTALVAGVNLIHGTWGSPDDFQLGSDAKRVFFGLTDPDRVSRSAPDFPLVRDAGSWFLAFTIVSGTLLLHRQWVLMRRALPALRKYNAIIPRDEPLRLTFFSWLLGINRKLKVGNRLCPAHEALDQFERKMFEPSKKKKVVTLLVLLVLSVAGAAALRGGEREGIFSLLAPGDLDQAGRDRWQQEAYHHWWAGDSYFFGHWLYVGLAVFAVLLILSFNTGGLLALYIVIALRYVAHPSADWWNRDGRYGWRPVAEIFRTVRLAMALLGGTLSVTVLLLGPRHIVWIIWLVVIYLVFLPLFSMVPLLAFRPVARAAVDRRVKALTAEMADRGIDPHRDIVDAAPFLAEIDRCWATRIRPLSLARLPFSTYVTIWLLPVALTVLQIVYAV